MKTVIAIVVLSLAAVSWGQTTRPTTQPTKGRPDPEEMMRQLLAPRRAAPPLTPLPDVPTTNESRVIAAPRGGQPNLIREGTIIPKRVGRLVRTADGQAEFRFEADGQAMQDPPMLIMPNLNLMQMENMVKNSSQNLKFRVSGTVFEYRSRNYLLIETVVSVESEPQGVPRPERRGRD